ncbi:1-aminocyclopropane-1-carboxylate synthase-like isoform X1 [Neltuma alba]|uniref:1-aminocyclopropane-1-carboxylate synthase-like isoform X1 n=2 Tax=Neltuma alba TaxID=207710 RepID=UPI0010A34186|nr:1-aminocyclopropane-1-carboxylate synthase-like isoform X1 [Prosopis alba]
MGLGNEESHQLLSNMAINDKHGENSPYFDGWKAYDRDPFHPTHNPQGVIQMGLAENQLCFDLIQEWIRNNPEASICTPQGLHNFRDVAIFQDYHGLPRFRNGVAKFMSKVNGGMVKFEADRIVMSGGATGANEVIMFCLADPGDAFLIPSPYYPAYARDLCWRTGVQIIPVHTDSSNNFQITKEALETAYKKAQEDNLNVKGLLITNPSNPLGTTLDRKTMKSLVTFINEKNIHLVCDEIYAATVFSTPSFVSVSEIIQEMEFCNRDLIHIVYSLSKDMGFPGFRVGIVYSYNDTVVSCARKMSSFGLVSSQTQHVLASMLSDDDFVDRFLAESSRRLAKRHNLFTEGLEKMGITCLPSNAGLFCWMNLRSLLKEQTVEGEMKLWRVIVNEVKLNISPGSSFSCSEAGWYRVCFANMDDETMEVALRRIRAFVGKEAKKAVEVMKNMQNIIKSLRANFSARFDEFIMSPSLRSPHSPIPHSSYVKA